MILIRHQNCKVQIAWQLQGSKPCSFTVEGTLGSIYFLIAIFFLERAEKLRIIILRRRKEGPKGPIQTATMVATKTN